MCVQHLNTHQFLTHVDGRSIFFAPCRVVTIVMEERFRYSNDDGASNEGTFLCVIVLSSVGDTTLMWTPFLSSFLRQS